MQRQVAQFCSSTLHLLLITGFNAPEKYCNWAMPCDIPNLDPDIPSLTV
jgi:hypothetical protein